MGGFVCLFCRFFLSDTYCSAHGALSNRLRVASEMMRACSLHFNRMPTLVVGRFAEEICNKWVVFMYKHGSRSFLFFYSPPGLARPFLSESARSCRRPAWNCASASRLLAPSEGAAAAGG